MSRFVADTHAIYWHLAEDSRLSPAARNVLREADAGRHQVLIPGIVLIEMVYLVEKGRLGVNHTNQLFAQLDTPRGSYVVAPLDQHVARALQDVPRSAVPEMPDRIIVATAYRHGLPVISADREIQRAAVVPVIW